MDENLKILKKYNLWGDAQFDLGYTRTYTEKLISYSGSSRLIKVLVGQRRSGKSYILRQVAHRLVESGVDARNTLFISREFIDFEFLSTSAQLHDLIELYLKEIKPEGRIYIFIDEIQTIEGWERVVNSYSQDFTGEYEIFISGSNSTMLSGELATLLSGRYVTFNIFPFSYTEYLGITEQSLSKQSYLEYMKSGGLPELFALGKEELKRNYISAIKNTVMLKDIIQRYNIRDPKLLDDIFVFLVNNASNLVSISSIVKYFKGLGRKTSYDGVASYIGYLEDTFLVHRCDRYDIKGKDTLSGTAKFYINDHSYKNYLYSGFGYGAGYMLENLVYLELRRAGYDIYVGNIKGKEVDFVAKRADEILYVQVVYMLIDEATVEREYSALEVIDDNYEKVVISLDDFALPSRGGVKHVQAWNLREELEKE
ncbi:MAG: ATP-binding protein [Rikenellaceae bacterium]